MASGCRELPVLRQDAGVVPPAVLPDDGGREVGVRDIEKQEKKVKNPFDDVLRAFRSFRVDLSHNDDAARLMAIVGQHRMITLAPVDVPADVTGARVRIDEQFKNLQQVASLALVSLALEVFGQEHPAAVALNEWIQESSVGRESIVAALGTIETSRTTFAKHEKRVPAPASRQHHGNTRTDKGLTASPPRLRHPKTNPTTKRNETKQNKTKKKTKHKLKTQTPSLASSVC